MGIKRGDWHFNPTNHLRWQGALATSWIQMKELAALSHSRWWWLAWRSYHFYFSLFFLLFCFHFQSSCSWLKAGPIPQGFESQRSISAVGILATCWRKHSASWLLSPESDLLALLIGSFFTVSPHQEDTWILRGLPSERGVGLSTERRRAPDTSVWSYSRITWSGRTHYWAC